MTGLGGWLLAITMELAWVSRNDGSATAFYDSNALGSTVGLTDGAGAVVNRYSYLPFGGELSEEVEAIQNPFEFVGQWGVMEEANGLDYMRARFYDSDTGKFTSPDPLGIKGRDTNLYRYAFNNSISLIDPEGTLAFLLVNPFTAKLAAIVLANAQLAVAGGILGGAVGGILGVGEYYVNASPEERSFGNTLDYAEAKYAFPFAREGARSGAIFYSKTGELIASLYDIFRDLQDGRLDQLPGLNPDSSSSLIDEIIEGAIEEFIKNQFPDLGEELQEEIRRFFQFDQKELNQAQTNIQDSDDGSPVPEKPDNDARSKGEPHLTTFDGVGYSFQGAGEFTLVQSIDDNDLNVQVRYVEIDSRATVANAVATLVNGQRVVIDSEGIEFVDGRPVVNRTGTGTGTAKVTVDGTVVEIPLGESIDVGNSKIFRSSGEKYVIVYAGDDGIVGDGDDQLIVDYMRPGTINIVDVALGDERIGQVQGLLGNLNGDAADDVALPNGTPLPRPLPFNQLYGAYSDGWRIQDAADSLFAYEEGQSPDTFYNPDFPQSRVRFEDLEPALQAVGREAALAAGYTPGTFEFISAAFDFAITGDPAFLEGQGTGPVAEEVALVADNTNSPTVANIEGRVWNDLNSDGLQDPGEEGLGDWTIFIDSNNNGQLDIGETSTQTDAQGNYQFTDLIPGIYTVAQVLQEDWQTRLLDDTPRLSFTSEEADGRGAALWNTGENAPEPARTGHPLPVSSFSSNAYYYLASRDYIDPTSPGAIAIDDNTVVGFDDFSDVLAQFGYTPSDFNVKFGLASLGDDIEGEDWFLSDDSEIRYYRGGEVIFQLASQDLVSAPLDTLTSRSDSNSPNTLADDFISGWIRDFSPTAIPGLAPNLQAIADTFISSLHQGSLDIIFGEFEPIAQTDFSQNGRIGAFVETIGWIQPASNFSVQNGVYTTVVEAGRTSSELNFANTRFQSTPTIITGTPGDDDLVGTDENDTISGKAGNDLIRGEEGDDLLLGGDGEDTIFGQLGNDILEGGAERDKLNGGGGQDMLRGQAGNDQLTGGSGDDSLVGGSGADVYIYRAGDGQDRIQDNGNTDGDTLFFNASIDFNDVTFSRRDNLPDDLVIRIGSSGDSLLIKEQFAADEVDRIEIFNFNDVVILSHTELANLI